MKFSGITSNCINVSTPSGTHMNIRDDKGTIILTLKDLRVDDIECKRVMSKVSCTIPFNLSDTYLSEEIRKQLPISCDAVIDNTGTCKRCIDIVPEDIIVRRRESKDNTINGCYGSIFDHCSTSKICHIRGFVDVRVTLHVSIPYIGRRSNIDCYVTNYTIHRIDMRNKQLVCTKLCAACNVEQD